MSNDNTYKLAWGRAIIETILFEDFSYCENDIEISFDSISEKILKYYWNQIFFFNLKQSSNNTKPPVIYSIVSKAIEEYKLTEKKFNPIWFDKAKSFFDKNQKLYTNTINKISKTLKLDVCWRYKYANKKVYEIYQLDDKKTKICIPILDAKILKEYSIMLIHVINYKWAQLLEKYNRSPRIVSKVQNSIDNKIRRKNLKKFKEVLVQQFKENAVIDFYTGQEIASRDISVDHVIPWSFMYSDDIWNLVLTSKSNNSRKSNIMPSIDYIKKLKDRNKALLIIIEDEKMKKELILSIEQDYVTKFYYDAII